MRYRNNNLTLLETNIFYFLIGILLATLGAWIQGKQVYMGLLITEYAIILIPSFFYLKLKKAPIKETLKLNKIGLKQTLYVMAIVILSYPIAIFLNFIGIVILSKFARLVTNPVPMPSSPKDFILSFFIISLTPALCEEVMFRGFILSSYQELGKVKAIIYSALLFGMFHFNLQNFLGPSFLGIIFAIIALKTDSIYSTILGHAINNTIALLIGYRATGMDEIQEISNTPIISMEGVLLITIIFSGILALIAGYFVQKLLKALPKSTREEEIVNRPTRFKMDWKEGLVIFVFVLIYLVYNYKIFFS